MQIYFLKGVTAAFLMILAISCQNRATVSCLSAILFVHAYVWTPKENS